MEELNTQPIASEETVVETQTPTEDNVSSFFNDVIKPEGHFATEEEFRSFLSDKDNSKAFFEDVISPEGHFGTFEEFSSFIGEPPLGKETPRQQGATQARPQQVQRLVQAPGQQQGKPLPIGSSATQSLLQGLKTPSAYYTQKVPDAITLPQARYIVSSGGFSTEDISNEQLNEVLKNKANYRSVGHMVDGVKEIIAVNRQSKEPKPSNVEQVIEKEKIIAKGPQVLAPTQEEKDPFGMQDVIEKISAAGPTESSILGTYDVYQQNAIDAHKRLLDIKGKSSIKVNNTGTPKSAQQISQEKAEYINATREYEKARKQAESSLAPAKNVMSAYAEDLTQGTDWQKFIGDNGKIDAFKLNEAAKQIALKNGFNPDGPAVKYIESEIEAKTKYKQMEPEVQARFAPRELKILQQAKVDSKKAQEDFAKVSKTLASSQLQVESLKNEINTFVSQEAEPIKDAYDSDVKELDAYLEEAKKNVEQRLAQNNALFQTRQISYEQAVQNEEALMSEFNTMSEQNYADKLDLYNSVNDKLNQINSKYQARFKRQQDEIAKAGEDAYSQEFSEFVKKYNLDEKATEELRSAFKLSLNETLDTEKQKRLDYQKTISNDGEFLRVPEFRKFASALFSQDGGVFDITDLGYLSPINTEVLQITFFNSIGTSIETLGNGVGSEAMRLFGKQMALDSDVLAPKQEHNWSDLASWTALQKSMGNLAGSMAPSLLATAAATALTGGFGLAATMTAGALAGWLTESTQMANQIYLDTLKETGDALKAQTRADKMWDFQKSIIFAYGLESLPFVGFLSKGTKAIGRRAIVGGAAELFTESVLQEFPQTLAEEAIMRDENALTLIGESYKGVGGYLASKITGDEITDAEQKAYNTFKTVVIETAPVALLGAGGQVRSALREQKQINEAKEVGLAYMQKMRYGQVNDTLKQQYVSRLVLAKGADFVTTMVTGLYTSGEIDSNERDLLVGTIAKSESLFDTANKQKLNKSERGVFATLNFELDNLQNQIQTETDPNVIEALNKKSEFLTKQIQDFLINKKTDLFILTLADGSQSFYSPEMLNELANDKQFVFDFATGNVNIEFLSPNLSKNQQESVDNLMRNQEAFVSDENYKRELEKAKASIQQQGEVATTEVAENISRNTSNMFLEGLTTGPVSDVETMVSKNETVDGNYMSQVLNNLYNKLSLIDELNLNDQQKSDLTALTEGLIQKFESYDNIAKGTTVTVTERKASTRPITDARKVKDQASAIENAGGKKGVLLRPAKRGGGKVNQRIASIDTATIPIESEVFIVRNENDDIVGYGFKLPDGNELFVEDPGGGIDLALTQKIEELGAAPQLVEQVFEDVMREVEVTPPTTPKPTTQEDAVQEQTAGQVPVQSEAGAGEAMAQGESQAEPQVAAEAGQEGQAEAKPEEEKVEVQNNPQSVADFVANAMSKKEFTYTLDNIDAGIAKAKKEGNAALVKMLTDAKGVMKALGSTNPSITIHYDQGTYTSAWIEAGGKPQDSLNQGFYISKDGSKIHINYNLASASNLVFHEGAHPVLDWLAENNPEVIDRLFDELSGLKDFLVGVDSVIKFGTDNYTGTQAKKEAIVEFMSRVADGQIKLPPQNTNLFKKIADFINNLLNIMGIDFGVTITDKDSITDVARKFTDSVKQGKKLDVKVADMMGPQARITAEEVLSLDVSNKEGKKVIDVAQDIEKAVDIILDPTSPTEERISRFLNNAYQDLRYFLNDYKGDVGLDWYTSKIKEFKQKLYDISDIAIQNGLMPQENSLRDEDNLSLFNAVLALSSIGINPKENVKAAFNIWKVFNKAENIFEKYQPGKVSFRTNILNKKGEYEAPSGTIVKESRYYYDVKQTNGKVVRVKKSDLAPKYEISYTVFDEKKRKPITKTSTYRLFNKTAINYTFKSGQSFIKIPVKDIQSLTELDNGLTGKGWTTKGANVALNLARLENLISDKGSIANAMKWLNEKHPISELREYNPGLADINGSKGKINPIGERYGSYIIGEKLGAFHQNVVGTPSELTMDLWWSRTWNRYMGTLVVKGDKELEIQEVPRTDAERNIMREAASIAANELGLEIHELQATLWYLEQQLYYRMGAAVGSYSFVDGVNEVLKSYGKTNEEIQPERYGIDLSETDKRRSDAAIRATEILFGKGSETGSRADEAKQSGLGGPQAMVATFTEDENTVYHGTSAIVDDSFIGTDKEKSFSYGSTNLSKSVQGFGKFWTKSKNNALSYIDHRVRADGSGTLVYAKYAPQKSFKIKDLNTLIKLSERHWEDINGNKDASISDKNKAYKKKLISEGYDAITFKEGPSTMPSSRKFAADVIIPLNLLPSQVATQEYGSRNAGPISGIKVRQENLGGPQAMAATINGQQVQLTPLPEGLEIINGFYSPIERRLAETKTDKQSATKWLTSGIIGKGDEAIYTGVKAWLESKKPQEQVSKSEIQQWMKDNRITVSEVVLESFKSDTWSDTWKKEGDSYFSKNRDYEIRDLGEDGFEVIRNGRYNLGSVSSLDSAKELAMENSYANELSIVDDTKYSQYQLEGEKENYKEVLITLPSEQTEEGLPRGWKVIPKEKYKDAWSGSSNYLVIDEDGFSVIGGDTREAAINAYKKFKPRTNIEDVNFKSTHFNEPNILVHLRMNTRTDADGNKVLFLEEIQSDWGQEGKKKGFAVDLTEKQKKINEWFKTGKVDGVKTENIFKAANLLGVTQSEMAKVSRATGVPSAPFVTDTNAWTKLALKFALKEAVAQGADKIAWTTGEQQNDRYDLSKQVDKIEVPFPIDNYRQVSIFMNSRSGGETIDIVVDNSGKAIEGDKKYLGENLENIVGKDIAEKIMSSQKGETTILKGDGLKIGGKGMKGFYGSPTEGSLGIVGNVAKSLFKQEVGTVEIDTGGKIPLDMTVAEIQEMGGVDNVKKSNAKSTQNSIDVTPQLKAEVQQGLPQAMAATGPNRVTQVVNLIQQIKAANPNVSDQNIYDGLKQSGFTAEEINAAMGLPAPTTPSMGIEAPIPNVFPDTTGKDITATRSIWEKVAKKAESDGQLDRAKMIRERALYPVRTEEIVMGEANALVDYFNGDVDQALDYVMNNPIESDIKTVVIGMSIAKAYKEQQANPTPTNIVKLQELITDFALYGTDYGQGINAIKYVYEMVPELFYQSNLAPIIATLADSLGNPDIPGTTMNKITSTANEAKKIRDSFFDKISRYYADEITYEELVGDDSKFDKKVKDAINILLKYGTDPNFDRKGLSELLQGVKDKGIFGLAETREEVRPLLVAQINDLNGKLKTPLNEAQINELANALLDFYEGLATQKMNALMNVIFNTNPSKRNQVEQDRLIKAIIYGALNRTSTIMKFGQRFNLPTNLSPQQQQQLLAISQQYVNAQGNIAKQQVNFRMRRAINNIQYQNSTGTQRFGYKLKSYGSLFEAYFYNGLLFALNTFDRAAAGNVQRTVGKLAFSVVRGDFDILREASATTFLSGDYVNTFQYVDSTGVTRTLILSNKLNETLDNVYSSLRGLPRLSEVKRSGLNEMELMIRESNSKGERMALRTFIVPANRIMSAVDSLTTPLNQSITKRQVYYELIKEIYRQQGIKMSKQDILNQVNEIVAPTGDQVSKAMQQARQDIIFGQLYAQLGFTTADQFPIFDPRLKAPLSKEAKIYNEWLYRTREILDSEESNRLKDTATNNGWLSANNAPFDSILTAKAVDAYTSKIASEMTFLGTPRGSMGNVATQITNFINYNILSKSSKYVGLTPLFVNASFNAVGMMIRILPGINAVQYAKYLLTGVRGAYKTGKPDEFGVPAAKKIDQQQMLATVITTNVVFGAVVAALSGLYKDDDEEKEAIFNFKWTGLTNIRLTKAQEELGYRPGCVYLNGKVWFEYRDFAFGPLLAASAFVKNQNIWSFDYFSEKPFYESEWESYSSIQKENEEFTSIMGNYILYSLMLAGEQSSIRDMSNTVHDLITIGFKPKMSEEDEQKTDALLLKLGQKKLGNFIKNLVPYGRLQSESKAIYDALSGANKKIATDLYTSIALGTMAEDAMIKTNGFDYWGRPVKDKFTLVNPIVGANQLGESFPQDRYRSLYLKNNYAPVLNMNESVMVHIKQSELMGGEEEFNKVVNEYRARVGTDEESKIKFKVNDEDEKLLIEFPLETEIVHKVNENTCKFVGKFVEKNVEQLEGLGDKKEFKNFMNKMYSLGRSIAMYQNPEDVKLDDRDRNDMHNFIEGKIKDLITLSNKNGFVWPDEFDWTLLIGETSDSPIPNTYKFK